ncbi:MAG: ribosome biogenesis GTPase Der [Acidobacteriota bacterium]
MFRVAIVGRPNVGKSTLFNCLTRNRRALVGNQPGMTRDRLSGIARWEDKQFEVVDTGGILPGEKEEIPEQVFRQAETAMHEADLILLVVDGRQGVMPLDQDLNALLRKGGREFWLVVNKIDTPRLEGNLLPFYAFGVEAAYPVSAEHKMGVEEVVDKILERVPTTPEEPREEEIRVAIIGRPNMGKSSLLNRLVGQERVIVTEIPGTTRDSVDTILRFRGRKYRLLDTAGIRRKGRTSLMVDKLSVVMARKSIEQVDVVLLIIDAVEGATKLDATIGGYAHEAGKSLIIVVNKWDLVERNTFTAARLEDNFRRRMRFLDYAPMVFVSAKTGQRVFKLLDFVQQGYQARRRRVPTSELNKFVETEIRPRVQSSPTRSRFPVMYASQTGVAPPTFVLFTRTRRKLHFSLERFFLNQLRDRYDFYATPIRMIQRLRKKS